MATLTLGQMLDGALGSSRDGAVDFEQLHNLLNAMLIHLGLKDLLVKENGEPLEGAEESPFAFLKELKQRLEANEKEMAEMRTLCQDLREEVTEIKAEQSRMAEDMKTVLETFDPEGFQNMLDDLRSQVLDAVMASMKDMMNQDEQDSWMKDGFRRRRSLDDTALIVIGNEITLVERTPVSRHWDTQSISLLSSNAKAQGREKDSLEAKESSHPASSRENDTGQNVGSNDMGRNMGQSDMGRKGMGGNVGQRNMGRNVRSSDTGRNDMEQNDMGQIKDEEIKMSISKAPPHIQKKSPGGGFTTSGMHPGAPATQLPAQRVQSSSTVQGHPGTQTLSIPAENAAGTSKLPTSKEERGGDSSRMEPLPAEDALIIRKMPSSKYSSCDQLVQLSGRHSEIIPSTPPPSPGFSGRLPRSAKQSQIKEQREQAAEGYSRRSPRYCGGRHTSTYPVQPMEPLLPDPNKPGVIELVGTDGFVYRGRSAQGVDSAHDSSLQK